MFLAKKFNLFNILCINLVLTALAGFMMAANVDDAGKSKPFAIYVIIN